MTSWRVPPLFAVLVPAGMAYAQAAGLPPVAG